MNWLYLINGMDNGLEDGMDYGLEDGMDYGLEDGTCNGTVTILQMLSFFLIVSRDHLLCALSHDLTTASSLRCWQVLHLVDHHAKFRFVFLLAFELQFPT